MALGSLSEIRVCDCSNHLNSTSAYAAQKYRTDFNSFDQIFTEAHTVDREIKLRVSPLSLDKYVPDWGVMKYVSKGEAWIIVQESDFIS